MRVDSFLERSAAARPDKIAVVAGAERVTYAELLRRADRIAAGLHAAGVERGDRVLILLDSSTAAVASLFGVLRAGAVIVVAHPTTKGQKLRYLLSNAEAACLITDRRRRRQAADALLELPALRAMVLADASPDRERTDGEVPTYSLPAWLAAERPAPPRRHISTDLAALVYTSGSTGAPKGVMLTHQNITAASGSIIEYLENTADDVVLNVLPLSFDYGLYQVLMSVRFGGTVVLERSFAFPHAVLSRAVEEKVTGFPLVPTLAALLLQLDLSAYDLSSLRYLTNTAAALPTRHIERLRDAFPAARLYSMYGLTECKRVAYLPPEQLDRRPGSVGIAMPDTEAWVVDDDGEPVGPGRVGELWVRGPHVMLGYWRNPEATAERLAPGRLPREAVLRTGDLFKTDEEGFLYFVGRTDDIIKSRGEKVAPREIENVLFQLPGVGAAAVIGVPDDVLGQRIRAYVAPAEGHSLDEQTTRRHLKAHLEDLLVPQEVVIRGRLPVTDAGKIDKLALAREGRRPS